MSYHALLAFALLLTCRLTIGAAESTKVDHPYLLWTQEDLGQLRQKVKTVPWAQEAYQQMREATDRDGEDL